MTGQAIRRFFLIVVMMTLVACAPKIQPAGMLNGYAQLTGEAFIVDDGYKLPYRAWLPEEPPAAVIIALHGFNDYSNAFAMPGAWWATRGIATYAYDQRGFGATAFRGVWPGKARMIGDLAAFTAAIRQHYPGVPLYLLGASMGGAVIMAAADAEILPEIEGVILVGPAVWGWSMLNPFYRIALWLGAHIAPGKTLTGQSLNIVPSDNIEMLRSLGRDPLVIKETRIDAIYGLVGLMEQAYKAAPKLHPPTLLLYGARDEIIPEHAAEKTIAHLPDSAQTIIYPDGYHMLLRDLQAPVVWRDISRWMGLESALNPAQPVGR